MPHIEEKDLVALHGQIEQSNKSLKQFEENFYKERKKADDLKNQRNLFIGISSLFLLFLGFVIITYFYSPSNLINESYLDANGLQLYETIYVDSLTNTLHGFNEKNQDFLASNALTDNDINFIEDDIMVYAVQVGAFEKRMVSMTSDALVNLKEVQEDEFYKYSVGHFDNLNEAQRFRKELLRIGFNDAFIASYENGRRIKIEEAW